jgi:peptidoglycan hydrolase-like protein with peptidoglycan-binding domain
MRSLLRLGAAATAAAALLLAAPAGASAGTSSNVAALQVALRALHYYGGGIDGIKGPMTRL